VGPGGGRPTGPTLQPLVGWLHGDTLQEVVEGNPKLMVGGGQTPWPTITWHVTNLTKSVTPPWTPINTPYRWISKNTYYLLLSTFKGFGLVVVVAHV
jgi:hypothetical protein